MARPPLPVGTHGQIRVYRLDSKRFRARTQFRDHDGVVRGVARTGPSASMAENLLKVALRDRGRAARDGEITGDTSVRELGELWLSEIDRAVQLGKRSPTTAHQYRYRFDRHVRDGLGMVTRWSGEALDVHRRLRFSQSLHIWRWLTGACISYISRGCASFVSSARE